MLSATNSFASYMDVVFLVYGLAFLGLGLTIVIRNERDSALDVARLLPLLAAFSFIHGTLEWMDLWRVVRGDNPGLAAARPWVLLASYLFLFEFGRRLVLISVSKAARVRPGARLLVPWIYAPMLAALAAAATTDMQTLAIWSRYLPGFFGSCLAGAGCWLYCRNHLGADAVTADFPGIRRACDVAAVAFTAYGVLGGLVVPQAGWFPASALSQESFLAAFGVPVQLLRAACAVAIALSVGTLLKVFSLENRYKLKKSIDAAQHALGELHRMNHRNEVILDSASEGIVGIGVDGNTLFVNDAAAAMLGYQSGELIGKPFHSLTHHTTPKGQPYPVEDCPIYMTMRDHAKHRVADDIFWRKDGTGFPVEYHSAPLQDGDQLLGVVVVFDDITARRRAERRFRESERRMHALLDASPESTLLLDPDGIILAINLVGAQRLGRTPEELVGTDFFGHMPPDLAAGRRTQLRQAVETAEPMHTSDQRGAIQFDSSILPVKGESGKVESVAIYARDVTERQRTQRLDAMFHRLDLMLLKWHMDLTAIAQMFCDEIRPLFDFGAIWIGRAEADGTLAFVAAAEEEKADFLATQRLACRRWDGEPGRCPSAAVALRSGHLQKIDFDTPDCASCGEAAQGVGIEAALMLPLTLRGKPWGILTLYARDRRLLDRPDIPPRLTAIASRLCVSLESSLQQEWLTLLDTALSTAGNSVFITDAAARILWANPAFEHLSGYTEAEMLGKMPKLFSSGVHGADFYHRFWETIEAGDTWHGEVVNARRDGSRYTVNQTVTPLRDANERISHYVSILEDISERKAAEERISHLASFDTLTDLPNRATFFDRLHQSLALARRDGHGVALLFLDLDRFKEVNDRLGHDAGDLLLKAVAGRLSAQVRESDTVARLAGDEFTITLPHVASIDDALHVAEKIVVAIGQPFDLASREACIGVSIGIALFPDHGDDVEALLAAADKAMYAAKHAGRNTVSIALVAAP